MIQLISNTCKESNDAQVSMLNLMTSMNINAPKHSVTDGYAKLCALPDLEIGFPLFYFACVMMEDTTKHSILFEMSDDQKVGYIKFKYQREECKICLTLALFFSMFCFLFILVMNLW